MIPGVVVTGAGGFLGSHLVGSLLDDGREVVALVRDRQRPGRLGPLAGHSRLRLEESRGDWQQRLAGHPRGAVVHLATRYPADGTVIDVEMVRTNCLFALEVFDWAVASGTPLFINADTSLPAGVNLYTLTKRQFVDVVGLLYRSGRAGLPMFANLELEQFYGPNDGRFISSLIDRLLEQVPEIALTDGLQCRDFIYYSDVVDAIHTLLERPATPATLTGYGVGTGECHPVREVVETLKRLTGNRTTRLAFGAVPRRPGEPARSVAAAELLREFGWRPRIGLVEGLSQAVAGAARSTTAGTSTTG